MWAYAFYSSRQWFKSTTVTSAIVPFIEIFNLREVSSVKFVENDGIINIISLKDIEVGEEVFMNDGLFGNRDLLEYYGFVYENNPADTLDVGVGLDKEDQMFGNKKELFHMRGIKDGHTFGITSDLIPKDLIYALRIYHLTIYDYDDVDKAKKR